MAGDEIVGPPPIFLLDCLEDRVYDAPNTPARKVLAMTLDTGMELSGRRVALSLIGEAIRNGTEPALLRLICGDADWYDADHSAFPAGDQFDDYRDDYNRGYRLTLDCWASDYSAETFEPEREPVDVPPDCR